MTSWLKKRARHPLALRLLFFILLISSMLSLVATGFQLYSDYESDVRGIRDTLDKIRQNRLQSIVLSLYNFNLEQLQVQLEGILSLEGIEYLEVIDPGVLGSTLGQRPSGRVMEITIPMEYRVSNDRIIQLGRMTIVASLDGPWKRLYHKVYSIGISNLIKVMIASVLIFMIIEFLVTRHLRTIARYAANLDMEKLDVPLVLRRKTDSWFSDDELDQVVRAVNEMRLGLQRDVRQRQEYENRLILSKKMIDSMPSAILAVDPGGRVTQWNLQAEFLTAVPENQALGQRAEDTLAATGIPREIFHKALASGKVCTITKVQGLHRGEGCFYDIHISPLTGKEGARGAVVRLDDVTQRVIMEDVMVHSEKMLSVGGLAAGMAHEINNPLAGILQNMQVIKKRIEPGLPKNDEAARNIGITMDALARYMEERDIYSMMDSVFEAGKRAADIVSDMLSFSRKKGSEVVLNDLGQIMDKTLSLASREFDLKKHYDFKKIRIIKEYTHVPAVKCDATMILQVLLNLLKNGAQAMAEKTYIGEEPCFRLRIFQNGPMVRMEVCDNGPGMDPGTVKRVFEPFFTTKEVGVGTGLGLSVSYFIVTKNHGGTMGVVTEPGKGCCFHVELPLETA
ncbi:MAG: ATP-binding protein [Pseudomonadota bacterium]